MIKYKRNKILFDSNENKKSNTSFKHKNILIKKYKKIICNKKQLLQKKLINNIP